MLNGLMIRKQYHKFISGHEYISWNVFSGKSINQLKMVKYKKENIDEREEFF